MKKMLCQNDNYKFGAWIMTLLKKIIHIIKNDSSHGVDSWQLMMLRVARLPPVVISKIATSTQISNFQLDLDRKFHRKELLGLTLGTFRAYGWGTSQSATVLEHHLFQKEVFPAGRKNFWKTYWMSIILNVAHKSEDCHNFDLLYNISQTLLSGGIRKKKSSARLLLGALPKSNYATFSWTANAKYNPVCKQSRCCWMHA